MKNWKMKLIPMARRMASLFLCVMMLCGSLPLSLAFGETQEFHSNEVGTGMEGDGDMGTMGVTPPLQSLLDWCKPGSATLAFTLNGNPISSGATLPRGADIGLLLDFALKDEFQTECDTTNTFYYDFPVSMQIPDLNDTFYGENPITHANEPLMHWQIVDNRLTLSFTPEFFGTTRNNVTGFVNFSAKLLTNFIVNGQTTYTFPGITTATFHFPLGEVQGAKNILSCAIENDKPTATYEVTFWADDNLNYAEIVETVGSFLTVDYTSATLYKADVLQAGGVTGDATGHKFTVNNVEPNVKYTVRYKATLPVDKLIAGQLAQSYTATETNRTNTAVINWKAYNTVTGTVNAGSAIASIEEDIFSLNKTYAGIVNGNAVFNISFTPKLNFEKLEIEDIPGSLFTTVDGVAGVLKDSSGVVQPGRKGTINNAVANTTYTYTYEVPFDFQNMFDRKFLSTLGPVPRTNTAKLTWTRDGQSGSVTKDVTISADGTIQFRKEGSGYTFTEPGHEGFLVNFYIYIDKSNFPKAFSPERMVVEDTLGEYFTLIPTIFNLTIDSVQSTDYILTQNGQNIKIEILNFDCTKNYAIRYACRVDEAALLSGNFASGVSDPAIKAKRQNNAKLSWKAGTRTGQITASGWETKIADKPTMLSLAKYGGTKILYEASTGQYYLPLEFSFKVYSKLDEITFTDLYPDMYAKSLPAAVDPATWRSQVVITGPYTPTGSDILSYDLFKIHNVEPGNYTIQFRGYIGFIGNGRTYKDIYNDCNTHTNVVEAAWKKGGASGTVRTTHHLSTQDITLNKEGTVERDAQDRIVTYDINGYKYAHITWGIHFNGANLPWNGATLSDQMFGRQMIWAPDGVNKMLTFSVGYMNGISTSIARTGTNRIGTQDYLQEFVYNIGASGEDVKSDGFYYHYNSLIRLPSNAAKITAENKVTLKHDLWGKYVENADAVVFDWDPDNAGGDGGGSGPGGPGGPASIEKTLLKVDLDATPVTGEWETKITVPAGVTLTNVVLSDYMNFWYPESYFVIDPPSKLDLSITGLNAGVTYTTSIGTDEYGKNRLYITFTGNITQSFTLKYKNIYELSKFNTRQKVYRNYADLEYKVLGDGNYIYYIVDDDYWLHGKAEMTKRVVPGPNNEQVQYDPVSNKYYIQWEIIFDDATRVGKPVILRDYAPYYHRYLENSFEVVSPAGLAVTAGPLESNDTLPIRFTPTSKKTIFRLKTYLFDDHIGYDTAYTNTVNLRNADDTENVETAQATVNAQVRIFQKDAKPPTGGIQDVMEAYFDETLDAYVIDWAVELHDLTRGSKAGVNTIIADNFPQALDLVPGSARTEPVRPITTELISSTGGLYNYRFTIGPDPNPNSDGKMILFYRTFVEETAVNTTSSEYIWQNKAQLWHHEVGGGIIAENFAQGKMLPFRRTASKTGIKGYDPAFGSKITWEIHYDEPGRAGQQLTVKELIPDGLIVKSVVVEKSDSTAVPFTLTDVAGNAITIADFAGQPGMDFHIVFTNPDTPVRIYVVTQVPPEATTHPTQTNFDFTNNAKFYSRTGKLLADVTAKVNIDKEITFTKNFNSGAYDPTRKVWYFMWKVELVADEFIGVPIYFEDTIPTGTRLHGEWAGSGKQPMVAHYTAEGTYISTTLVNYEVDGYNIRYYFTPISKKSVILVYTAVNEDYMFYEPPATAHTFLNVVKAYRQSDHSAITDFASASTVYGLPRDNVLSKSSSAGTNNRVSFSTVLNFADMDLNHLGTTVTLTDTLASHLKLVPDSVKVTVLPFLTTLPPSDYVVNYNNLTRELSFTVPDNQKLQIEFDCSLNGIPGTTVNVTNTINLTGLGLSATTVPKDYLVTKASAGLEYDVTFVKINKFDEENVNKKLAGAKFQLFEVDHATGIPSSTFKYEGTTDVSGELYLPSQTGGLQVNKLYMVKEVERPAGYALDTTEHYFLIPGDIGAQAVVDALRAVSGMPEFEINTAPEFNISNEIELRSRVTIEKLGVNGAALAGATLQILSEDKATILYEFTSAAVPTVIDNICELGKVYWLREKTAPAGYKVADDIKFELTEVPNGKGGTYGTATVVMQDIKNGVIICKVDSNGMALAGARLQVTDPTGTIIDTWTSNGAGHAVSGLTADMVYTLRELDAPPGYIKAPEILHFSVNAAGTVTWWRAQKPPPDGVSIPTYGGTIVYTNKPYVKIIKHDENDQPLAGASLELYKDSVAPENLVDSWISSATPHVVPVALESGTYVLFESDAPAGYEETQMTFTYTKGQTKVVTLKNEPSATIEYLDIVINKTWHPTANVTPPANLNFNLYRSVNGGAMALYDAPAPDQNPITLTYPVVTRTITGLPKNNEAQTETYTYEVREELPAGYVQVTNTATMSQDGTTLTCNFANKNFDIYIQKRDQNEDGLAGAQLTLYKEGPNGLSVVDAWTSVAASHQVHSLTEGRYVLKETEAPDGYYAYYGADDTIATFDVTQSGLTMLTQDVSGKFLYFSGQIVVYNKLYDVQISKFEGASSTHLPGAKLELYKGEIADGATPNAADKVDEWISDGTPHKVTVPLKAGKYTLIEIEAPSTSYHIAPYLPVTIVHTDATQSFSMRNYQRQPMNYKVFKEWDDNNDQDKKRPTSVQVRLLRDGVPVPGTEVTLSASNNPPWSHTWTDLPQRTNAGGFYTYSVEELNPAPYAPTLAPLPTPPPEGNDPPPPYAPGVKLVNRYAPETTEVTVEKKWVNNGYTGQPSSVTVQLMKNGSTTVGDAVELNSTKNWKYTWEDLPKYDGNSTTPIAYTVVETTVPSGYLATTERVVDDSETTKVTITNTATRVLIRKWARSFIDTTNRYIHLPGAILDIFEEGNLTTPVYTINPTTGAEMELLGVLTGGKKYVIKERKAPDGFIFIEPPSNEDPVTVDLTNCATAIAELDNYATNVVIRKFSSDPNGAPISGATLELRDSAGTLVKTLEFTDAVQVFSNAVGALSDASHYTAFDKAIVLEGILKAGETYTLTEIEAPLGYKKVETPLTFVVPTDATQQVKIMYDPPSENTHNLRVKKVDQFGNPVVGAVLAIRNMATGVDVATWTTVLDDDNETKHIFTLPEIPGKYELYEVSAPPSGNYTPSTQTVQFYASATDPVILSGVTFQNKINRIIINGKKFWSFRRANGAPVDITLNLYQDNNFTTPFKTLQLPAGQEDYTFDDNIPPGHTYEVREAPLDGFYTRKNGNDFTNTETGLKVYKYITGTTTLLGGATLELVEKGATPAQDKVIGTAWNTTDENPKEFYGVVTPGKAYYIREVTPPSGYLKAANVNFVAQDALAYTNVPTQEEFMYDTPIGTLDIQIDKTWVLDPANITPPNLNFNLYRSVNGGTMALYDAPAPNPANPILLTSGTTSITLTGLPKTNAENTETYTYEVREVVPAGYAQTTTPTSTMSTDGTKQTWAFTNKNIWIYVEKKDQDGNFLPDAEFTLYELVNGVEVPVTSWDSGSAAHLLDTLSLGEYILRETRTPDGYIERTPALSTQFKLTTTGLTRVSPAYAGITYSGNTITCTNQRRELIVSKLKFRDELALLSGFWERENVIPLANAELALYKGDIPDGVTPDEEDFVETWITDGTPHKITAPLQVGTYTIIEINAPPGFQRVPNHRVVIDNGQFAQELEIFDIWDTLISYTLYKVWNDNNNQDGQRPESIRVQLSKDGVLMPGTEVTLSADTDPAWTHTWNNLMKFTNTGSFHVYTAVELSDPAPYSATLKPRYTPDPPHSISSYNYNLENSYSPEATQVTVEKKWVNNGYTGQPSSVTVQLMKNGTTPVQDPVTLNAGNLWKHTWSPLPKYEGSTTPIDYTVVETVPTGYLATTDKVVDASGKTSVTITNTATRVVVRKWARSFIDTTNRNIDLPGAILDIFDIDDQIIPVYTIDPTTAAETVLLGVLTGGKTYIVKERGTPNGFILTTEEKTVDLTTCTTATVEMDNYATNVVIRKFSAPDRDHPNGEPISGATLELRDSAGTLVKTLEFTDAVQVLSNAVGALSDASHYTAFDKAIVLEGILKAGETYTLVETVTPLGYKKAPDLTFVVPMGQKQEVKIMYDPPSENTHNLRVKKVDQFGNPVEGAKLAIRNVATGVDVATWTTVLDVDGETKHIFTLPEIPGKYELYEQSAPPSGNYTPSTQTVQFYASATDPVILSGVTFQNKINRIIIKGKKFWSFRRANGAPVDITLNLYQDNNFTTPFKTLQLPAGQVDYTFDDNIPPGHTYEVREAPLDGFYTTKNGNDFTNTETGLKVYKYITGTTTLLGGATLELVEKGATPAQDKVIGTAWNTTDENPKEFYGVVTPGKAYYIREVTPPSGYLRATRVEFIAQDALAYTNVATQEEFMYDTPITKKDIKVTKVWDSNGAAIATFPDVTFELFQNGTRVDTVTLTHPATEHTFGNLETTDADGNSYTYDVQELTVAGYHTKKDTVPGGYKFTNTYTKVTVEKKRGETTRGLAGAMLEIWEVTTPAPSAPVYGPFESTENGFVIEGVLSSGKTYELRETFVPAGFIMADPVTFTVDQPVKSVPMKDLPTKVVIRKLDDQLPAQPVVGATLEIWKEGGTAAYKTYTTTAATQIISKDGIALSVAGDYQVGSIVLEAILEPGNYTLKEKPDAPAGYLLASPINFTVDDEGAVVNLTMVDVIDTTDFKVLVHKKDQFGDYVVGAVMRLYDLSKPAPDDLVEEWETDGQAKTFFLQSSTTNRYKIEEVTPPRGYTAITEPYVFNVSANSDAVKYGITLIDPRVFIDVKVTKTWRDPLGTLTHPTARINLYRNDAPTTVYQYVDLPAPATSTGTVTYTFANLPAEGPNKFKYTYTTAEVPMDGYVTVKNGDDYTNTPTNLIIHKRTPGGQLLPGVELGLYLNNVLVGSTWTTNPKQFVGVLKAGETYELREITAPLGYQKITPLPILIKTDGTEQSIDVEDPLKPWELTVRKVALNRSTGVETPLANVRLGIFVVGSVAATKEWTTDGTGSVTFTDLDPTQQYVLKEITPPSGFTQAVEVPFQINTDAQNKQIITMTNYVTKVEISKLAAGASHVAGAILEIREGATPVRRWQSNGTGSQVFYGLKTGTVYTLMELIPPPGHVAIDNAPQFTIATGGTVTVGGTVPNELTTTPRASITMIGDPANMGYASEPNFSGNVSLTVIDPLLNVEFGKNSDLTLTALDGAEMELYEGAYAANKTPYLTWTSAGTPYKPTKPLQVGQLYTLHEHKAPDGYRRAADMSITIANTTNLQGLTMVDLATRVSIAKVAPGSTSANPIYVEGAELTLREAGTNGRLVETWTTIAAPKEFIGVLVPDRDYILTETKTPAGYSTATAIPFRITQTVSSYDITMEDKPLDIRIAKMNHDGTGYLDGVELELYAGASVVGGTKIDSWTTNATSYHTPAVKLETGKTYTVHEVSAPVGYTLAPDVTFTVRNGADQQIVEMRNIKTEVRFIKLNQHSGQPLAGAALKVVDTATGNTVANWTSAVTPHVIYGLPVGSYSLVEDTAPAGFAKAVSVPFTVNTKQQAITVTMEDPFIYKFSKVDATTRALLSGAVLHIEDMSGNIVEPDWTSSNYVPHEVVGVLKAGTRYRVVEVTPPFGYQRGGPWEFTFAASSTPQTFALDNVRTVTPPTLPPGPGPNTVDVVVTKRWVDNNNAAGIRPSSIKLNLFQKLSTDTAYPAAPLVSVDVTGTTNTWRFTFADLDASNASNVRYDYLVTEDRVAGYDTTYANNGRSITNTIPQNPNQPTATPFATPTALVNILGNRIPLGVKFVDGEWVYIDEYNTPLGTVALTGNDTNWILIGAAALMPLLVAVLAAVEIRRRKKHTARKADQ